MSFFEPWQQYKTPCVRQLAFCLASPNIIQEIPEELELQHHFELHQETFWQSIFEQYQPRLAALDRDPSPLLIFLQQLKSTRLGLRFERLLLFWFNDHAYHCFTLLGHSIQQICGKQTLGELDFVVFNRETQHVEHWEVAIKYYLAKGHYHLDQWYGLNNKDTLARKLTHFSAQQFQFNEVLQHGIDKKYAVIKGQLFCPIHQDPKQLPSWVNQQRRIGFWGSSPCSNLARLTRHEWITANKSQPKTQTWWLNGLYCNAAQNFFYMYQQQFKYPPFKYDTTPLKIATFASSQKN